LFLVALLSYPLFPQGARADEVIAWDAPSGVRGWCTVAGYQHSECFADPVSACKVQFEHYAGNTEFYGAEAASRWDIYHCKWKHLPGTSLPSEADFYCATGFTAVAVGRCVKEDFTFACCRPGAPDPYTEHPINLLTGAKVFRTNDYISADGAFSFDRTFVSSPYGALEVKALRFAQWSMGNWNAFFDVQLQLPVNFETWSDVTVLLNDGTASAFKRQTDGSYKTTIAGVVNSMVKLQFVGTYPGNSSVLSTSTQWLLTDSRNNIWTLQTRMGPGSTQYNVGKPVSEQRPDGTVLTFGYDANDALTTITDQSGKSVTLAWNLQKTGDTTYTPTTLASVTFANGQSIKYWYEASDGVASTAFRTRLKKVEYLDDLGVIQDSVSYLFENTHYPTSITAILDNAGAVRWRAAYDDLGRATLSSGPNGEFSDTVVYSASGTSFSRTQTNSLGRQIVYNFTRGSSDWSAKLVSITEAATPNAPASTISNTFDTSTKWLATSTDKEGRITKYTRNANGQPTQIVEGYGTSSARTTAISWSPYFNLPTQIVETELTTTISYDGQGRLLSLTQQDATTQTVPYSTNGQTRTWTYSYGTTGGEKGKLISIDGPLSGPGDTEFFGYNTNGYLASVTDEVGKVTSVTSWDWRGAPLTVVDPNNVSTTFTYDIHGRMLTATVNPGAVQSQYGFIYDVVGNLTKITLPKSGYLQYSYDAASRLTQVSNEKSETLILTPNAVGESTLSTVKNAAATVTQQQSQVYDELGRLIQVLGTASTTPTNLAYDKVDNLKAVTDGRSQVSTNSFDALNRVISETNPDSQSVQYGYNAQDVMTSHKDGRNLETSFVANGFGDVIREVSPDRGTRTYWYDNAGRMTKLVDGDGEETDFTYDNSGRLLTQTFPDASWENLTYSYDDVASGDKGNGRLTSVTEQSGSTAFVYDAQGRITKDTRTIQDLSYPVRYDYDTNGDISQLTLPSGRVVTYARDNSGLITAITTQPSATGAVSNVATSISYQPFGPLKGLTYGNGLSLANTYNLNGWLTRIRVTGAAATTFDLGYQYYDDGSLGEIDDNAATGRTVYMSLSNSGRLTYAGGPWGQNAFSYDAAGNRTGSYLTIGGVTTADNAITSGSSNRLVKTADALGVTKRTLSYRDGGDLYTDATAGGSTFQYLYSARKRLVVIKQDGLSVASYGYDFKGQRVWRTIAGILSSPTIHYIFDEAGHLLSEQNGYTGDVLREYIWLDDKPLAVIDSTSGTALTYYIHSGHLDEPQVMTDASKTKVWDAYVTPFGSAQVFTSASANVDIRLPGQWFQQEAAGAGLNQNHYRDYDPSLGRYIEADPIGLNGGQNPYAYVDGDVYDFADNTGLIRPPIRPSNGGRGITASQPEPLSLAETVYAARIDAANIAGRRISPNYRGYTYVGRPDQNSAETAENMLNVFAFRQAITNEGFCLAPNSPGYSLQNQYLRYLGQYGKGGVRFLSDGRIRFYGQFRPAKNSGPTAGAQMVREWNPANGGVRDWNQGSYGNGNVRFVAPKPPTSPQNHVWFGPDGSFKGRY